MEVSREELLRQLESVQGGTTKKDSVEQSSCFCIKDGQVITFSDEVACFGKCSLNITGAIPAAPLLTILPKLQEDVLDVEVQNNELLLKGKRRRISLKLNEEISLPYESLEAPGEWKPLNEEFAEAIASVEPCAAPTKSDELMLTYVHIHPDWVEACDRYQVARWELKTGASSSYLVKRDSIKHIIALGMTEISESNAWVHFRNPAGLRFSCRRVMDEFIDTTPLFALENPTQLILPKSLIEDIERAELFSKDGEEDFLVVELRSEGKLRLSGYNALAKYMSVHSIKYSGPNRKFRIAPRLLMEVVRKFPECLVNDNIMMAKGAGFLYATALGAVSE